MSGSAPGQRRALVAVMGTALLLACGGPAAAPAAPTANATASTGAATEGAAVGTVLRLIDREGAAGRISARAPDFEWMEPDSSLRRLTELEGRVVVINFWATWCIPCRTEMPTFQQIARTMPEVAFLMLALREEPGIVREFAERYGLTDLKLISDPDGSVARAYGVFSLPLTVYVGRTGIIRHIDIGGPLEAERIRGGIAKASN